MASSFRTRLGNAPEEGIKAPCVVVTIANMDLEGTPSISGWQITAGDRILVRAQDDPTENGIYNAASGTWTRATDWNRADDVVNGVLVLEANGGALFKAVFEGDYEADVTVVLFVLFTIGGGQWPPAVETRTLAAGQTVVTFSSDISTGAVFMGGNLADTGLRIAGIDYTITGVNEITLAESYPANTICSLLT